VKKAFVAALASLMLAGVLAAVSPASTTTKSGVLVIVGEGSSPIPLPAMPVANSRVATSLGK
jgi:hypothetical protein